MVASSRLAHSRKNVINNLKIDLVLDVGANEGQWANEVLRNGYLESLISFEPVKKVFLKLESNANSYKNWKVVNTAIGKVDSINSINVAGNNALSSSFFEMEDIHLKAAPDSKYIEVEKVKLSRLAPWLKNENNIYLKIDTQGFEMEILQSVPEKSWHRILGIEVETSLVKVYSQPYLIEDIIKYLRRKDFKPYRLENGMSTKPFGQLLQVDIIFVKKNYDS